MIFRINDVHTARHRTNLYDFSLKRAARSVAAAETSVMSPSSYCFLICTQLVFQQACLTTALSPNTGIQRVKSTAPAQSHFITTILQFNMAAVLIRYMRCCAFFFTCTRLASRRIFRLNWNCS